MAGRFNSKNLKRGISYLKRNGIVACYYKVAERLMRDEDESNYTQTVLENELTSTQALSQKFRIFENSCLISILVPTYNPDKDAFNKLLESVAAQTYTKWELIIADAGDKGNAEAMVEEFVARHSLDAKGPNDDREFASKVIYRHLDTNQGISGNTNEALELANGQYIALLDHDDELTSDALYETICVINGKSHIAKSSKSSPVKFIYSDEDKVSYDNSTYFDWHRKCDYDPIMLLTNNYICHLAVIEAELAKSVKFDPEYDGSQDYDFFLRCVEKISEEEIVHIPKALYHWRSSKASTAENPDAKLYAYEAGKRAVKSHLGRIGIEALVSDSEHLGFFNVDMSSPVGSVCVMSSQKYEAMNEKVFNNINEEFILVMSDNLKGRDGYDDQLKKVMAIPEVGATTGKIIHSGKIESAGFNRGKNGGITACFKGLNQHFSGYLHRANLLRCVDAYDKGCVMFRKSALKWNGDGPVLKDGYKCVYVPYAVIDRR